MNTTRTILALLAFSSLSAFAEQRDIVIKCIIGSGKDSLVLPASKSPMKASTTKEIHVATEWDLPKRMQNEKGYAMIQPLTPLAFETMNVGWEIYCSADTVGELIRLVGSATFTESELTRAVFGEQSEPIYSPENKSVMLTPNVSRTATLHSSTSPFQLFAIPGKEYEIRIRRLNKWIPCRITCDYGTK